MPLKTLCLLLALLPLNAQALACWMTSGASINFGNLLAGEAATVSTTVKFSCQAEYGVTQYLNVCLSSVEAAPFRMTSVGDENGEQYTLRFGIVSASDRNQVLDTPASGNLPEQSLVAANNHTISGQFSLLASVPAGQNNLPPRSYFTYDLPLRLSWHSAITREGLAHCRDGSASAGQISGSSRAQATLATGCFIARVTALNFGTINSAAARRPSRSTATITARCPAGTAYSIGLSNGTHASGNQRQLCNTEGRCLRYGLWQDAGLTQPWGEQRGISSHEVQNSAGGVQQLSVYGEVPAQPLTGTGHFDDDVVVTLTY